MREDNITTGTSNDLEKATGTLLNMIRRFGMNAKSGLLNYDVWYNNGFQRVQDEILEECRGVWMSCKEVRDLLRNNRRILEAMRKICWHVKLWIEGSRPDN